MKSMTVGQLYFALGEKAPIYLRAVTGEYSVASEPLNPLQRAIHSE